MNELSRPSFWLLVTGFSLPFLTIWFLAFGLIWIARRALQQGQLRQALKPELAAYLLASPRYITTEWAKGGLLLLVGIIMICAGVSFRAPMGLTVVLVTAGLALPLVVPVAARWFQLRRQVASVRQQHAYLIGQQLRITYVAHRRAYVDHWRVHCDQDLLREGDLVEVVAVTRLNELKVVLVRLNHGQAPTI